MGGQNTKSNKNNFIINNPQTPMEEEGGFKVIRKQNKQVQVILNNKYFLKEGDEYYEFIDMLVYMINEKNQLDKHGIMRELGLTYYSTIQFVLGKCKMQDEKCMICLEEFQISKSIEEQLSKINENDIFQLNCSHKFHRCCLTSMIGDKKWAKCPICMTIFGFMTGDQPEGTMKVTVDKNMICPGYPKGTIIINYNMFGFKKNGVNYPGTTRVAYLPNTPEGIQICELLEEAFKRKLVFTIGTSVSTGLQNQIVWNGIHHKTSLNGGAAHFGFPDQSYLKRVREELSFKNVHKNKKNK